MEISNRTTHLHCNPMQSVCYVVPLLLCRESHDSCHYSYTCLQTVSISNVGFCLSLLYNSCWAYMTFSFYAANDFYFICLHLHCLRITAVSTFPFSADLARKAVQHWKREMVTNSKTLTHAHLFFDPEQIVNVTFYYM